MEGCWERFQNVCNKPWTQQCPSQSFDLESRRWEVRMLPRLPDKVYKMEEKFTYHGEALRFRQRWLPATFVSSCRVQRSSFSAINCGGKRHLKGYTSQVLETELTESTTNNCFLQEDAGNQSTTEMIFCGVVDLTTAMVAFSISTKWPQSQHLMLFLTPFEITKWDLCFQIPESPE